MPRASPHPALAFILGGLVAVGIGAGLHERAAQTPECRPSREGWGRHFGVSWWPFRRVGAVAALRMSAWSNARRSGRLSKGHQRAVRASSPATIRVSSGTTTA
jgi:hypothetical protein